jgi:CO dehydrogenase maturation factor
VRIAIAGKGGSGKTTISGTLARFMARAGRSVLAIDADSNPNLASTLGIPVSQAQAVTAIPRTLMERRTQPDGTVKAVFVGDAEQVLRDYGADGPDGIRLLIMGRVGHAGAG